MHKSSGRSRFDRIASIRIPTLHGRAKLGSATRLRAVIGQIRELLLECAVTTRKVLSRAAYPESWKTLTTHYRANAAAAGRWVD